MSDQQLLPRPLDRRKEIVHLRVSVVSINVVVAGIGDPARNFVRRWERHRARQVFYQLPGPMLHLARE